MNAAEQFGVEELGQATLTFMRHCVNVCTACELLKSAERYIQYKSTKVYVSKVNVPSIIKRIALEAILLMILKELLIKIA